LKINGLLACCQDFALALPTILPQHFSRKQRSKANPFKANLAKSFFEQAQKSTHNFLYYLKTPVNEKDRHTFR
jgi:hypothetical protein